MERRAIGAWLSGPGAGLDDGAGDEYGYRGERLGLPEEGTDSIASISRRVLAIVADWLMCYLIVVGLGGLHPRTLVGQFGVLGAFAVENVVLISTIGYTVGMRLASIKVVRLGSPLTPLAALIRTVLLCLVIPAAIWDRDARGMHDKIAGTAVVHR